MPDAQESLNGIEIVFEGNENGEEDEEGEATETETATGTAGGQRNPQGEIITCIHMELR
jgi:hypothetical protein